MAKEKEINMDTAQEILDEYKDQKTFSMKDTIKLMKKSGLSYKQVMEGMKIIGKETERLAAEAEARGEEFDRKEFLNNKMKEIMGIGSKNQTEDNTEKKHEHKHDKKDKDKKKKKRK